MSVSAKTKTVRLLGFAAACMVLAAGVLFCLFAPNINPNFINTHLFEGLTENEKQEVLRMSPKQERAILEKMFAGLEHPLSDADFAELGIPKPEDIYFKGADQGKLHGWYFATPGAKDTVLLSGAWRQDVRFPALAGYVEMLQRDKLSVFVYDYRGLGSSEGKLGPTTALEDGLAAYDYLVNTRKIDPKNLILMGRTTGAYISCQISKDHPCKALVLEEPWINLKDYIDSTRMVTRIVPLFMYPGDGLDNMRVLKEKHPPILIVGTSPWIDKPREIYDQIDQPKNFVQLDEFRVADLPDLKIYASRYANKIAELSNGLSKKDLEQ